MPISPVIEITYCRLCGWGLRAGWMAQELLTTFADELGHPGSDRWRLRGARR
jgi:selenoprotein W-related protein